jgi:hypothetical protein
VTDAMFGRQNRIDEAETARAGWDDTSGSTHPREACRGKGVFVSRKNKK